MLRLGIRTLRSRSYVVYALLTIFTCGLIVLSSIYKLKTASVFNRNSRVINGNATKSFTELLTENIYRKYKSERFGLTFSRSMSNIDEKQKISVSYGITGKAYVRSNTRQNSIRNNTGKVFHGNDRKNNLVFTSENEEQSQANNKLTKSKTTDTITIKSFKSRQNKRKALKESNGVESVDDKLMQMVSRSPNMDIKTNDHTRTPSTVESEIQSYNTDSSQLRNKHFEKTTQYGIRASQNEIDKGQISAKTQIQINTTDNKNDTFDLSYFWKLNQRKNRLHKNSEINHKMESKRLKNQTAFFGRSRPFLHDHLMFVPKYKSRYEEIRNRIYLSKMALWKELHPNETQSPLRNDSCNNCFKNDFKILLNPKKLCKQKSHIDIIILISSSPRDFKERRAIRDTWGSLCNHVNSAIKCIFTLGNFKTDSKQARKTRINGTRLDNITYSVDDMKEESSLFKDIVQFDFIDSYGNLTYKTLSGINWAMNFCPTAKYVMKTDTDMFVNTIVLPLLIKKTSKTKFIGGYCWGQSSPNRNIESKWFVSHNTYRKDNFPPMCSGTGYLLSSDVARSVLNISKNIPFFYLEDVYIALCIKYLGITPIRLRGFSNMKVDTEVEGMCAFKDFVITSHEMAPDNLYKEWEQMKSCKATVSADQVYGELPFPYVT